MIYVVVEEKKEHGYITLLECSEELHAKQMVEELYRESKQRKENRNFKYIELPGNLTVPKEKPRKSMEERIGDKLLKLYGE